MINWKIFISRTNLKDTSTSSSTSESILQLQNRRKPQEKIFLNISSRNDNVYIYNYQFRVVTFDIYFEEHGDTIDVSNWEQQSAARLEKGKSNVYGVYASFFSLLLSFSFFAALAFSLTEIVSSK